MKRNQNGLKMPPIVDFEKRQETFLAVQPHKMSSLQPSKSKSSLLFIEFIDLECLASEKLSA